MFFNLFSAVESHTSVKVTHGTRCIDQSVQRCNQGWSYGVSTDSFP